MTTPENDSSVVSARDALSLVDPDHTALTVALMNECARWLNEAVAAHAKLTRLMKEVAAAEDALRECLDMSERAERELIEHGFGGGDDE